MAMNGDTIAFFLTFKLALLTTLILLILGTPIAWWLARTKWRYKFVIESIVALPLVLPPTVLGFYLLVSFGPQGAIGATLAALNLPSIVFTFTGLVIGSVIYSLPFVVQPLQQAFSLIGQRPLDVAATLGASPMYTFLTVVVPLAKSGFITASVLGFAHTLGEFGIVLMIGGNIPGETQVVSIAIYEHVEALAYSQAHTLSFALLLLSFVLLAVVYRANGKYTGIKS